jgi:STE24 endopeptidase
VSAIDPTAAAAAYLGQIPAAQRAAAAANTAWTETLVFQGAIVLLGCLILIKFGLLAKLRSALEQRGYGRWAIDALCGAVFCTAVLLATLAHTAATLLRAHPELGWAGAVLATFRQDAPGPLVGAIAAAGILYGVRSRPRYWGVLVGGVFGAMMIALFWLPYVRAAGPANLPVAPAGPARAGLMQLIRDTKVPAGEIYLSSDDGIDADVTGTGQHARVVISRGLWAKASPATLRASIGHLIGHYRHGDQLSLAALLAALTFATFLGIQLLAPPVARRLGLEGAGDPAALPLLAALFLAFFTADVVIEHAFIRAINVRADQFSLDNAREPDGLAQALLLEWHGEKVDPAPLQEALFYDHPSLQNRLIHAMSWKAAHPG